MTPAISAAKKAKITFQVHKYHHDPRSTSYGTEATEALAVCPRQVFKTLILDLNGKLGVAIIPVTEALSFKLAAKVFGTKRVKLAAPREAERSTGYLVGGISPLGQKKRLTTAIDATAFEVPTVYVSAGHRGLEIELAPRALCTLTRAMVASLI